MQVRITLLLLVLLLTLAMPVAAGPRDHCNIIQSGEIVYPEGHYWAGQPVVNGFDAYGFNYQLEYFTGWFVNSYLGFWGFPPYGGNYNAYIVANPEAAALGDPADPSSFWALKDLRLVISWNTDYRSRTDCDNDGWFDRHYGYETYIDSGAWYTNRVSGTFAGEEYVTFSQVQAVPASATLLDGIWYASDGSEFGYAVDDAAIGMAGVYDWMEGQGVLYEGSGYTPHTGLLNRPGLGGWHGPNLPEGSRWDTLDWRY